MKTAVICYYVFIRIAKFKKTVIPVVGKYVKELELAYSAGGDTN